MLMVYTVEISHKVRKKLEVEDALKLEQLEQKILQIFWAEPFAALMVFLFGFFVRFAGESLSQCLWNESTEGRRATMPVSVRDAQLSW